MATTPTREAPLTEAWRLLQGLMFEQRGRVFATAAEFELTPPQLMSLRHLDPDVPVPMSELARWLHCDASNVTGIVDRLEGRGLVERRGAPNDRRVKMLALTDKGIALRDELAARMSNPPDALAEMPVEDQRALRDILRRALS